MQHYLKKKNFLRIFFLESLKVWKFIEYLKQEDLFNRSLACLDMLFYVFLQTNKPKIGTLKKLREKKGTHHW